MGSLILRTTARLLVGLLLLFSIFLLLRGHNQPGGGFSGGLVGAAAFVLFRLSVAGEAQPRALQFDTRSLIAAGLLVAAGSALLPMLLGHPFMTALWVELSLLGEEIELGTPVIFDVGVYLAVVGVTLTMIFAMGEE